MGKTTALEPRPAGDKDAPAPAARHLRANSGLRETIESLVIAFALAFLFKTFEAEAFVIPTGSMAPTLMGRHKDVVCPECGYRYSASGSEEADHYGNVRPGIDHQIIECTCPVCRFPMSVDPLRDEAGGAANPSYSGDRIWVSKVPYNFADPQRWDVIVFRFPEEAETYYIKRLVGLPGESVKILHGDIFTRPENQTEFSIQSKPPDKVRAMAQIVHDNDYQSKSLDKADWPLRWQVWSRQDSPGAWQPADGGRSFRVAGSAADEAWIRYEHLVPAETDWRDIAAGRPLAERQQRPWLITDFYAFNTRVKRHTRSEPFMLGLHWVGDLIVDCQLDVQGPQGQALFDLVKGGRHFRATIDVASGQAELSIDGLDDWRRTAQTAVRGAGKYNVMFANVDRQLLLWIDGKLVAFDGPTTYEDLHNDTPQATTDDAGDLAPVGIGSRGAALAVEHLRVLRDIYYIADRSAIGNVFTEYRDGHSRIPQMSSGELAEFLSTPSLWQTPRGNAFDRRSEVVFDLAEDQFFVLGDNSPASSDARLWLSQQYVDRDLLVGKALFVYWPHPWNVHVPFTDVSVPLVPNFSGMGLIR